jgi:hypothetical protein
MAGRDPILPACLRAKSPFGASGVTPGHGARALLARSVFCRVREFKTMLATLQRLFVEHSRPLERKFHAPTETT